MNLIITCARHTEEDAAGELARMLGSMGDDSPEITVTPMSGIITARTTVTPASVPAKFREALEDEPWSVRYCLRVIPVFETVRTDVGEIVDAATAMALQKIPGDATYRVTVEKRNTGVSGSEIISRVARGIGNPVSLEHADATILIEILGGTTGISVLSGSEIFSAEKVRRGMNA